MRSPRDLPAIALLAAIGCGPGDITPTPAPVTPPSPLTSAPPTRTAPARTPITREAFRDAVLTKSAEGVVESLGKPDRTTKFGQHEVWYYEEATMDEQTGKVDPAAVVIFEGGLVLKVEFN